MRGSPKRTSLCSAACSDHVELASTIAPSLVFAMRINKLERESRRGWKTLRAALRKHWRRRITTTLDNPQRGLNLVPRIATIELKKDGPDLAGGDWG
jgi:hypothetical protein